MAEARTEAICDLVSECRELTQAERSAVALAFEDTLAVVYAGWHEPASQAARSLHPGEPGPVLSGTSGQGPDAEAFLIATAGHALDYDDVQLVSVTHPSVVLVPTLLALRNHGHGAPERLASAFAVGLAVNVWLGHALGPAHYAAGWHATSTIGPVAGAAAAARLLGLDRLRTRHALALAAAQSAGMQVNFGSDAKPLQAGFAASAAVRAALLARAGATAAVDAFAPRGFLDLYGGSGPAETEGPPPEIELDTISRKLFPCCYAAHRMISAAIEARRALGPGGIEAGDRIVVEAPHGSTTPLRVSDPRTGQEGKFCAAYLVCAALIQGRLELGDFTDEAVTRPRIRRLMERTRVEEAPADADAGAGLDHGSVRLSVLRGGSVAAAAEVRHHPGSPRRPATERQMAEKLADCLARHRQAVGRAPAVEVLRESVRTMMEAPRAHDFLAEGMTR